MQELFYVTTQNRCAAYIVSAESEEHALNIVVEEHGFDIEDLYCEEFVIPENSSVSTENLGW